MTNDNMEETQRIIYLLSGRIADRLTDPEKVELDNWVAKDPANRLLADQLADENFRRATLDQWKPETAENSLQRIKDKMVRQRRAAFWPRIAAAASILLCLGTGFYFYTHKTPPASTQLAKNDLAPGGNRAILTLANGKTIILTGAKNGRLAAQGNIAITKTQDGQVVYHTSKYETGSPEPEIVYNIMTTPRGGQYHLTLTDGTNVWLNAASSIRYPAAFTGNTRQVAVTGEAYFEVAHNAAKPFMVTSKGQVVEVLGTHFDVSAYADEPSVRTTLLAGSVRITKDGQAALLKPGERAEITEGNGKISVTRADTEDVVAWKDGLFRFSDERLESIMRQLSRWYDVDIRYNDEGVKALTFNGIITHFSSASKVLRMLELTGQVHFRIEGKKIIVSK